jgi:hypothetical protein
MKENYEELASLINKDLDTSSEGMLIHTKGVDQNLLKLKLTEVIDHLLNTDFEKLCNAMYRLDVSEHKFHKVLTEKSKEEVAPALADLVIEREWQKVRTRRLYKDGKL